MSKFTNKWEQDELDFLKDNYILYSDDELSNHINRTPRSIAWKRKQLGLTRKSHNLHSFAEIEKEMFNHNYILLSSREDYRDCSSKMKYICKKHFKYGEQEISLGHLLSGEGCYYCGREKTISARYKPLADFEEDAKQMCIDKNFQYISVCRDAKNRVIVNFICNNHVEIGVQQMTYHNMKRNNILGCKYCFENKNYKFSKGERAISLFLDKNNIGYVKQYKFGDCRDKMCLPFDFYLYDYNLAIEYDGQHHYHPVCFNGISVEEAEKDYNETVRHDNIKTNYCINNNIKLLRIPYWDFQNINNILMEELLPNQFVV